MNYKVSEEFNILDTDELNEVLVSYFMIFQVR